MQPYEVDQLGGKLYRWLGLVGPAEQKETTVKN